MNTRLTGQKDIGVFLEEIVETTQSTCKKTFKHINSPKNTAKGKSVPWWTDALKIEENDKCSNKKITTRSKQRRTTGEYNEPVHRREEVPSGN